MHTLSDFLSIALYNTSCIRFPIFLNYPSDFALKKGLTSLITPTAITNTILLVEL